MKSNGKIVARSSFTAISSADKMEQPNIKENMARFTLHVNKALRSKVTIKGLKDEETPNYLPYSDWDGQQKDPVTIPDGDDDYDVSTYDPYLDSQVYLPHEGETKLEKVKSWKRDSDSNLIGRAAANPIQDTREYVVGFEDGSEGRYSANIISQNIMISRIDSDGNQEPLLRQLVAHRKKPDAIPKDKAYIKVGGKYVLQRMTKGWDLCVEWADGRTTWVPLALLNCRTRLK